MAAGQFDSATGMVIQARMSSTRMPGKVLMPLPFSSDKPMLANIVSSLNSTGAKVIIATSVNPENDAIANFCIEQDIAYFRGSEEDVLSRFLSIQEAESFDTIFRFTADNPFIDLERLWQFYQIFLDSNVQYAFSTGMPLGMNFEVMKGDVLSELKDLNLEEDEREHVTLKFKRDDRFRKSSIALAEFSNIRLTVDTPLDYAQASLLYSKMNGEVSLGEILRLKKNFPWLFQLNDGVIQKSIDL